MIRHTTLLAAAVLFAGCSTSGGGGGVEKTYPSGDLYEERVVDLGNRVPTEPSEEVESRPIHVPNRPQERGLVLTVTPDSDTVTAGDTLALTLSVMNTNTTSEPLNYTTGQRFDAVLFRDPDQRRPVYVWSEDRAFTQIVQDTMVGGGASMTRVLQIPTATDARLADRASLSDPVGPGTYYMWVTHEGTPFLARGPIEIKVLPR